MEILKDLSTPLIGYGKMFNCLTTIASCPALRSRFGTDFDSIEIIVKVRREYGAERTIELFVQKDGEI
jgi:hypothetical protein